jgi:hypothetical protein
MNNDSGFVRGFRNGFIGSWRYGYFAPITAFYFAMTRKGSYLWHFKALYRLCFGRWDLVAVREAQRQRVRSRKTLERNNHD